MTNLPDDEARQKALDPSRSYIVQAPAGSGKTELLIQRYLRLLAIVECPEQILAMTFTRKAAGEMKHRIVKALDSGQNEKAPEEIHALKTWTLAKNALAQDRLKGWNLLDNPTRLKIQTIDSFCTGLVKQMPLRSELGGPVGVEERPQALYKEAARRILSSIESNRPEGNRVRSILSHLDGSKSILLKRIMDLYQKRDQWMTIFHEDFSVGDETRIFFERLLQKLIASKLREVSDAFPQELEKELVQAANYAAENLKVKSPAHPIVGLESMLALPLPDIENYDHWQALTELLLTKAGDIRKTADVRLGFPSDKNVESKNMKKRFTQLLETLSENKSLGELLKSVQNLPPPRFTEDEWKILQETIQLFPLLSNTLRRVFKETGRIDFSEITLSARKALGTDEDPTDLLLYLDYKLQHILVDEFQDTSFKQFHLLEALTSGWERDDGRSLFIVGDPQQSIYRFRDAEVGLFLKAQENGIGEVPLAKLTLTSNFRSHGALVDWFNACFQSAFPHHENSELGAISYSPSTTVIEDSSQSDMPAPGVELHSFLTSDAHKDTAQDEAETIAALSSRYLRDCPQASIAILVKSRAHLAQIVATLRDKNIPFQAEEIDILTSRPAIQDLLALMRALLSPNDDIAWASILRAPWCGMSLQDLQLIRQEDLSAPLALQIRHPEIHSALTEDGRKRLERFNQVMEQSGATDSGLRFRDLLEGVWISLGGPACIGVCSVEDIEVFFDEIEKATANGDLSQLNQFSARLDSLYAAPQTHQGNALQIMTMHKAKGLEFDIVLLPGLGKKPRPDEKRLVYWMPYDEGILIAPIEEKGGEKNKIYEFINTINKTKNQYESARLLYVATTRAKRKLHLLGHTSDKEEGPVPARHSALDMLWPHLQSEWVQASIANLPETPADSSDETPQFTALKRLAAEVALPEPDPDIEIGATLEMSFEQDMKPLFFWAGSEARYLGTSLHRCFQKIAEDGAEQWDEQRIQKLHPKMIASLQSQGLSKSSAEAQAEKGMRALKLALEDSTGRWILSNREQAETEYALTRFSNNRFIERIIDRTFIDKGIRWIIDFKTGEHQGSNLESFFEEEMIRYRPQLDQYESILIEKGETLPIKKALYYPLHSRLVEL
ncbi:MAG: UvrD-helicase domain-containing protein [Candidatus Nitrohelix vancouverensis]|uniref:DNA 3'-5' helicase n=1 Tax=Candidatus Nitrohelix vancouverensis TaxID=2705534 RepID=A0A7T0G3S4_9BACT|nr:MAG: UvrD-helicase domain-containing protein [Candidatus Nitrohelix vancouverensis]